MSVEDLKVILKEKGLRITPQRVAVFNAIKKSKNHPSVEDVYKIVSKKYENISISTVYQIMRLLDDIGMINLIELNGIYRYDSEKDFHLHAICPNCKKIDDLFSDKIEDFWNLIIDEFNLNILNKEIIVYRLCQICNKIS